MVTTTKSIKQLNPRNPDTKYMGEEPLWRIQPGDERVTALSRAFNWYNYFYGKKEAKDMIAQYLDVHERSQEAKKVRKLSDSQIRLTTGWLCRMTVMGLELNEHEQIQLDNLILEILNSNEEKEEVAIAVEDKASKPNIQDRLREKVSECAGELEGMFDDFVGAGAKMSADYKPIALMRTMNISPLMVNDIKQIWTKHLAEFEEVIVGKNADLVAAYNHLSKIQLRNCVKFCEQVINDCGAYVQIKKVERKPRKVKLVSPEKRANKFKICTEFKELALKSLPAAQLVEKTEAWLYDTKKRKLIHIVADEYTKAFTLKNNTVIGFSTAETVQKTLRKPAEQLKSITTVGKPAARKAFKDIKATETAWNGRGSENLVILKAF
jgi:hypothetical protein